jgi:uncharacterized membrane protein (UPF0127 family)
MGGIGVKMGKNLFLLPTMANKKLKSYLLPGIFVLIIILGGVGVWYSKQPVEPKFTKEGTLAFGSKDSTGKFSPKITIDIEVAASMVETTRGLMYRRSMDEMQGMLFIFDEMEEKSFWMKNTYIPLDIIYTDDKGKILTIQPNTKPFSEDQVPSYVPSQFVVEVNAGFCKRHGISEGDWISVKMGE